MPVSLVMELLAVHEEIETIKGEEMEKATKSVKNIKTPKM